MNKVSEFSELVQPTHINTAGTLFGGYMLSWLDLAAAKAAEAQAIAIEEAAAALARQAEDHAVQIQQTWRF